MYIKFNQLALASLVFFCLLVSPIITYAQNEGEVAYGEIVEGELLSPSDCGLHTIWAEAGDEIRLRVNTDNVFFNPEVTIFDESLITIISEWDGNLAELSVSITETGCYTIQICDHSQQSTGIYCLALQETTVPPNAILSDCEVSISNTLSCEASSQAVVFYSNGLGGIILNLTSTDVFYNPEYIIYDPNGTFIQGNWDGTSISETILTPIEGCYTIFVMSHNGSSIGPYDLTLNSIGGNCTSNCSIPETQYCSTIFDEEICGDGEDNDGNGLIDCEDVCGVSNLSISSNSPIQEGQDTQLNILEVTNATTFNWTGPSITDPTVQNPTVSGLTVGTYEFCVTASNENGCSQEECITITIEEVVTNNTASIIIEHVQGIVGETVNIPVYLSNCTNIATFQGTIILLNNIVANIADITTNLPNTTVEFNPDTNGFILYSMDGLGTPISEDIPLFYIVLELTGMPGDVSTITMNSGSLAIELYCFENDILEEMEVEVLNGSVEILQDVTASGLVLDCNGNPVNEVEVTATITDTNGMTTTQTMTTEMDGAFLFSNLPIGSNVVLSCYKNINPTNGLSSFDLFLMQRYILGLNTPQITDVCQVIAGDANCNGSMTTSDIILSQLVLLELESNFGEDCPSWEFYDATFAPNPFNINNAFEYNSTIDINSILSDASVDFKGVHRGDINLSADAQNFIGADERGIDMELDVLVSEKNDHINYQFQTTDYQELVSMQFALEYEGATLEFVKIKELHPDWQHIKTNMTTSGILNFSWFDTKGNGCLLPSKTPLFEIIFRKKGEVNTHDPHLDLAEQGLKPEAYTSALEHQGLLLNILLDSEVSTSVNDNLFNCYPNPAHAVVSSQLSVAENVEAKITLTDALGQVVYQANKELVRGQNNWSIDVKTLPIGLYFYSIQLPQQTMIKQFVIAR